MTDADFDDWMRAIRRAQFLLGREGLRSRRARRTRARRGILKWSHR